MLIYGVYETEGFDIVDALLISAFAVVMVFAILAAIILITTLVQKSMEAVDLKTKINPRPENEILEKDPDAVVAALTATIEYYSEFKTNAKLVSIEKIDED